MILLNDEMEEDTQKQRDAWKIVQNRLDIRSGKISSVNPSN